MPVVVQGAVSARKALKQISPDLAKESQKEIAGLLKEVTAKARGFVPSVSPMSGWAKSEGTEGKWATRAFDYTTIKRGISYSTARGRANRKGFRSVATIYNKSAAGAIYETAGRKSGNTGKFTPNLGGSLKGKSPKMTGRAMFRAWDEDGGKTNARVIKAIEKCIQNVYTATRKGK
jgi:hypothetical protein